MFLFTCHHQGAGSASPQAVHTELVAHDAFVHSRAVSAQLGGCHVIVRGSTG
jgi:hypothetical protein